MTGHLASDGGVKCPLRRTTPSRQRRRLVVGRLSAPLGAQRPLGDLVCHAWTWSGQAQGFFETDAHTGYSFMRNLAEVIGRRLEATQTMRTPELQFSAVKQMQWRTSGPTWFA